MLVWDLFRFEKTIAHTTFSLLHPQTLRTASGNLNTMHLLRLYFIDLVCMQRVPLHSFQGLCTIYESEPPVPIVGSQYVV